MPGSVTGLVYAEGAPTRLAGVTLLLMASEAPGPVGWPGRQVPPVNGDQVRSTSFSRSSSAGYDAAEVDDLLRRVAAELDVGRPAGPVIENATFRMMGPRRRYDVDAVDWFLEQLARVPGDSELAGLSPDPWGELPVAQLTRSSGSDPAKQPRKWRKDFAEECANAWRNFDQQPGMYLRWGKVKGGFWSTREFELCTADHQRIASLRGGSRESIILSAAGRSFTVNRPKIPARSVADSWPPGIAKLAACSWQDRAGHFTAKTMKNSAQRGEARIVRELVDEAGIAILHTGGMNFQRRACARITFPHQRWLRFLVRGTGGGNAIMTALDQTGNKVARYRVTKDRPRTTEIAVHPNRKLTDELILAIALSQGWLVRYFASPE